MFRAGEKSAENKAADEADVGELVEEAVVDVHAGKVRISTPPVRDQRYKTVFALTRGISVTRFDEFRHLGKNNSSFM